MQNTNEIQNRINNMTDAGIVDYLSWFGADIIPSLVELACTVVSFSSRVSQERRRVKALEWGDAAKKAEMDVELMAAWDCNLEFLLGYLAERTDKAAQVIIDEAVAAEAPGVEEMVRGHIDAWFAAPGCDPHAAFSADRQIAHGAYRYYDMVNMAKWIRELYIPTVLWNRAAN